MENKKMTSSDDVLQEIKKRLEAQGADLNKAHIAKIHEALNVVRSVRDEILAEIEHRLQGIETGFYKSEPRHSWLNMGFDTPGSSSPRFRPTFDFEIIADEIIISVFAENRTGGPQIIWRTDVGTSDFGDVFRQKIRNTFVAGLQEVFGR